MKKYLTPFLLFLPFIMLAQNKVGINTIEPQFDLDVRGTDNELDGGELQLGTPGQTNFLRFFGGRLGDRNPFMAFHDEDTFHIVTTSTDWLTFQRRLTMLPDGNVGIGTENPLAKLDITAAGDGKDVLRLSTDRPWVFRQLGTGADTKLALQQTVNLKSFYILSENGNTRAADFFTANDFSQVRLVPDGGAVAIGTESIAGKLNVKHNSTTGSAHLHLSEDGDDFARIKMESINNPGAFWDIAGKADTITNNSRLNFYFSNATNSGDRMTITGIGDVGIGNTNPQARLDILGGDWNLEAGNPGDLRIGNSTYNLRFGVATGGGGAGISRIFAGGGAHTLIFGTNNMSRMAIASNGNVGIGTTSPTAKLHVNGDFRVSDLTGSGDRNVVVDGSGKFKIGSVGVGDTDWNETTNFVTTQKTARIALTTGSPPATNTYALELNTASINAWEIFAALPATGRTLNLQNEYDGDIHMVSGGGQVGIGISPGNSRVTISGPDNNGTVGSLEIQSSNGSHTMLLDGNEIDALSNNNHLHLNANSNGPVSIGGLGIANDYKLSVHGKVIAEEVRVQLVGAWPDYVFSEDYNLMPIESLEASIKQNGHLPGIPSATQIESEGLDVGDMHRRVMEKIEELTLYIIDLKKENAELKKRIIEIESR